MKSHNGFEFSAKTEEGNSIKIFANENGSCKILWLDQNGKALDSCDFDNLYVTAPKASSYKLVSVNRQRPVEIKVDDKDYIIDTASVIFAKPIQVEEEKGDSWDETEKE